MGKIIDILQYPTMWYALIICVLVSFSSSLFGTTLVLKRFSFIGDGLSHVAFGAAAVAGAVGLTNNIYVTMPVTIASAIILLCSGQKSKIKGDAAVAMISVGALAFGYIIMKLYPSSSNASKDVCDTLFGSANIYFLKPSDVITTAVLAAIVTLVFIIFYHRIFAITFDENFARATGTRVSILNIILSVVIAIVIVIAMKLVGSLLISALIIFPALSSMRVFKSYRSVIICSAIISVLGATVGVLTSYGIDTPASSTIVIVDIIIFAGFWLTGMILRRIKHNDEDKTKA